MPDEEMIYRCIAALVETVGGTYYRYENDKPHMVLFDRTVSDIDDVVIAIIKAMREPTEKMIKAADVGMQSDFYPPDMTWQIMIDEILK